MLRGKIEELFERLEAEGKVTVLPNAVVKEIDDRIGEEMTKFRQELAIKAAQSQDDTSKIILNA